MDYDTRNARMLERACRRYVAEGLAEAPAVVLLGPRQVGKTTLALRVAADLAPAPSVYLDLESELDRAKLATPEAYFADHRDKLVILDEVHRVPGLFPVLRGQIDLARREGRPVGRYLLLGSASVDLLRESSESLAGRARYLELPGLQVQEIEGGAPDELWVRGGFPESFLAPTSERSLRWRQDFVRTYLERDVTQFVSRVPAETLRRLWVMLAHLQGTLLNVAELGRNLGMDVKTVGRYLDLLVDLFLVRRLEPWHENLGKRLVKSPKVYVRDSGVVHALLGIPGKEVLLSHPVVGRSWEGFVIENLLAAGGSRGSACPQAYFFRTSAGAEIDLLLVWPDQTRWAIEIKRGLNTSVDRGFHQACEDLRPSRRFVVHGGTDRFRLREDLEAIPLGALAGEIAG